MRFGLLRDKSLETSSYASAAHVFRYTRLPGTAAVAGYTASDLAESFTFRSTRTYEPNRNLIATVSNFWGAAAVSSFAYTNDALGRRTRRVDSGGTGVPPVVSTNYFCYNARSDVTNAAMGETDYSYRYDDIGNRERATTDAALTVYAANALNQYASVTAAGQDVPVAYDLDGNMLTNGVWTYAWDAENRMASVVSAGATVVSNAYDYLNRRVRKAVYAWDSQSTAYSLQSTAFYVWDGWNIAAEIVVDAVAGSTNVHFYTWGLDLSGSTLGAGGVGGLLADTTCNRQPVTCNTYFPCYDANGNVTDYVDAGGNLRARYAYSAFGEITSQSGDMAGAFTHRFSTKPFDAEAGVSKFQLRDYLSDLGRWGSRDPIEEVGGLGLYGFILNNAILSFDVLGLGWPEDGSGQEWSSISGRIGNFVVQDVAFQDDRVIVSYGGFESILGNLHVTMGLDMSRTQKISFPVDGVPWKSENMFTGNPNSVQYLAMFMHAALKNVDQKVLDCFCNCPKAKVRWAQTKVGYHLSAQNNQPERNTTGGSDNFENGMWYFDNAKHYCPVKIEPTMRLA